MQLLQSQRELVKNGCYCPFEVIQQVGCASDFDYFSMAITTVSHFSVKQILILILSGLSSCCCGLKIEVMKVNESFEHQINFARLGLTFNVRFIYQQALLISKDCYFNLCAILYCVHICKCVNILTLEFFTFAFYLLSSQYLHFLLFAVICHYELKLSIIGYFE